MQEGIAVAVGIEQAGPAAQHQLKFPTHGRVDHRTKLGRDHMHIEPGIGRHCLDDFARLHTLWRVVDEQAHTHRRRHPRLLQQGLCRSHVVRRYRHASRVVGACCRDRLRVRLIHPRENHLRQRGTVQRQLECVSHAWVARQRRRPGEVNVDRAITQAGHADDVQLGVGLGRLHIQWRHLGDVQRARLQVGQPDGAVRDHPVGDAIIMDAPGVPVSWKTFQHDAVLRHALNKTEGPGAYWV